MIVRDIIAIAMRALRSNKLRSGLTMLGLIIGVAAVILLTSFGQGLTNSVNAAVAPVANSVTVVPKLSPTPGGPPAKPLTDADVRALAAIRQIDQMVPFVTGSSTGAAGQVSRAVTASVPGAQYLSASVMGTTANFPAAAQKTVSSGAFFTQQQSDSGTHVVVLGPLIATALYGPDPEAPVGKKLRINHALFQVIGVMESFGATSDNAIIMPMRAARSGVSATGTAATRSAASTSRRPRRWRSRTSRTRSTTSCAASTACGLPPMTTSRSRISVRGCPRSPT